MMKWLPAEMLFKRVFLVEICMKQAKKSSTLATTITSFLFTLKGQASPRKLWQDLGNKRRVRSRISEEMDRVLCLGMPLWEEYIRKLAFFLTIYRFRPFSFIKSRIEHSTEFSIFCKKAWQISKQTIPSTLTFLEMIFHKI